MPDCLQPLLKQVLLKVLGNLEQCWTDPVLKGTLLGLPLSNMELLLSFDQLKVRHHTDGRCSFSCVAVRKLSLPGGRCSSITRSP